VPLTGVEATGSVGDVTVLGDLTIALTGVEAICAVGDVTPSGGDVAVSTGAAVGHSGKPRRRRHYLEIDGQYFEVQDEADAVRIVKALNEAAKEAAPQAVAEAVAKAPKAKPAPVVPFMTVVKSNYRPEFVQMLQAKVDAANAQIAVEYQRAAESYAAWQEQQDDDEEISMLLTMGLL
jgi:hypothetical protein